MIGTAAVAALACLTPVAPHEPPCNPYAASSEWSTSHRNSYAQHSSPFPAPHPGDAVMWQDLKFQRHPGDPAVQKLMHLDLLWRDSGRLACSVPVNFGDPSATDSINEQSVLVRGYSAFIVNNARALDRAFGVLPPPFAQLSELTGNVPGTESHGVERIDWDPATRTCHPVWANRDVSIPNAIPTLSTESGLLYAAGVRDGVWGLESLDLATGASKLWVPTSPLPSDNSFYAATTVGPGGDIWIGGFQGINVFRGPDRPAPRMAAR